MIKELIGAFLLVFVAEMGDKTQILAMMFATKYKASSVLGGVFIGALLNHGLAVLLGATLGNIIPLSVLSTVAGAAFIYFAFASLKEEEEEEEHLRGYKSAVMTVGAAFFIGELGDKTQLSAITLAMGAVYPCIVLLGTVSAMVVTSSIGIWVGSKVGKKIPKILIKVASAVLFFIFGSIKLVSVFLDRVSSSFIVLEVVVVTAAFVWGVVKLIENSRQKSIQKKYY